MKLGLTEFPNVGTFYRASQPMLQGANLWKIFRVVIEMRPS
jgi:hypothetical protein